MSQLISATKKIAILMAGSLAFSISSQALAVDLIVAKKGAGSGVVTSSPAGISCGSTCRASFARYTNVSLTASPAAGSRFSGWTGACSGTATTVKAQLRSKALTCTASFALKPVAPTQYSLTISRTGTGTGAVTSAPSGISCGSVCANVFNQGTTIALTAAAAGSSTFIGWSGNCTGTNVVTAIALNASASCNARFDLTVVTPPADVATLSWDPVVAAGLAGYRVYYGTAPGNYFQALGQGLAVGLSTSTTLSGFTSGTRYYFVVTAYDSTNIESLFSNEVFKDMP